MGTGGNTVGLNMVIGNVQEIVNNITTPNNVVGKALDARQGKVLNDGKMNRLRPNGDHMSEQKCLELYNLGFDLSYANLSYADLSNAYLESANLSYADLYNADLSNAYLESANLDGANLPYANLSYAYLESANLSNANLSYADLYNANLPYADLYNANLPYANLSYAYLESANLDGAYLDGANLDNANLYNATGLSPDINIGLSLVSKNPNSDTTPWPIIWTDNNSYNCNPETGIFTVVV
jgi:hypothetical protein